MREMGRARSLKIPRWEAELIWRLRAGPLGGKLGVAASRGVSTRGFTDRPGRSPMVTGLLILRATVVERAGSRCGL